MHLPLPLIWTDDMPDPPLPPLPKLAKPRSKPGDKALRKWQLSLRDTYLRLLLWRKGCGGASLTCPRCETKPAKYRCRECGGGMLLCRDCCLEKHVEAPLHVVDEWSGTFFYRRPLVDLGQRIQFGHAPGKACDTPRPGHEGFVVIHDNGIHKVAVDFCGCERRAKTDEPFAQLLKAGWYPATDDRLQTCATFEVLEKFDLHTLQAKTSAYDFYIILERLTDSTGVKPPDRYQVFLRMAREYRHLLLLLRCGRGHDPSGVKDPALGSGWGYMVESGPYRKYLLTVTDQKEMSTCSGLAALDHANTKFSKGYSTTGVGMCVCARHEFVQPNGVGDLQKGEHYANMDYIFGSVLRHKDPRMRKIISYDIVCQWWKNLVDRLKELPPLVRISLILELCRFVIPKMHIHSHMLLCQLLFSLNLVPGSANTDGEGIERPWSWIGGLAGSTRANGPGARSDTLDLHWFFWNWMKLLGLPALLRRRLDNAKVEQLRSQEAFEAFSLEQAKRVPEWKRMVEVFEKDGTQKNPYEAEVKGLTEMQVRLQFAAEEEKDKEAGIPAVHEVSPSTFVAAALDLEEEQRWVRIQAELKKSQSTALQINLRQMRTSLNRRILKFRKLQATYQPGSIVALRTRNTPPKELAEDVPLMLPSALTEAQRAGGAGCMAGLVEIEKTMREAQCCGALVRLRNQLHIKSRLLLYKKNHACHQGMNTRSRTLVAQNESKIRLYSEKYQVAHAALVALAGEDGVVGWPKLKREDIRCMQDAEELSKRAERQKQGLERRLQREAVLREDGELPPLNEEGGEDEDMFTRGGENVREVSWIWTLAGRSGTDAELEDALRIEWAKSWARAHRWNEEENKWLERVVAVPVGEIPEEDAEGMIAYAAKQADMYRKLAEHAEMTRMEVKLKKGERRKRYSGRGDVLMLDVEQDGEEEEDELCVGGAVEEQDEEENEEEEEDDDERGDVDSEEELLMGGEINED
ncbi:hypothetical protein DFH07DRAFT_973264 [Mycena maculata]|uniref:CxC2-like cysteine cluster KDZ transposase-associated domain-containing protein n=1 Tax=Mycena maculata TaxID=230809 RepID=A0AAD7HDW0_9AGAR|nr:hypothetical protein DFH07DRAFT_973264 [Mycena maculata]